MAATDATLGATTVSGVGAAPTSNFQSDAAQNIDATKLAALADIARSGSQTQGALALAGQQQAATRAAALKSALAFSAARGGAFNAPVQTHTQEAVSAPFDARQAALDMIRSNYAQDTAATNNAYGGYFDLTKAGLPVAQAALQRAIVDARAKAAATAAAKNPTSQALASLGGAANAGQTINDIAAQENATGTDINGWSARTGYANHPVGNPNDLSSGGNQAIGAIGTPSSVGAEAGLPAAVAQALAQRNKAATQSQTLSDQIKQANPTVLRQTPAYSEGYAGTIQSLQSGRNPADLYTAMVTHGVPPAVAYLLIQDAQAAASKSQSYANSKAAAAVNSWIAQQANSGG